MLICGIRGLIQYASQQLASGILESQVESRRWRVERGQVMETLTKPAGSRRPEPGRAERGLFAVCRQRGRSTGRRRGL